MPGDSAYAIEAKMREERSRAERWLKQNRAKLPPEEPTSGQVQNADGKMVRREVALVDGRFKWELMRVVYDEASRFVPMQGQDMRINIESMAMAKRVNHVLTFMPVEQRELLLNYYIEGMAWHELVNGTESRQAVHQRLSWARNTFEKQWLLHAQDAVELGAEDF